MDVVISRQDDRNIDCEHKILANELNGIRIDGNEQARSETRAWGEDNKWKKILLPRARGGAT